MFVNSCRTRTEFESLLRSHRYEQDKRDILTNTRVRINIYIIMFNSIRSIARSALAVMKNSRVDVVVRQGKLRGIVVENVYGGHYTAFRGIPYAQPPIGDLRFKDPQPPEAWTDVRDASEFSENAAQVDLFTREIMSNEDCLYLNVYTTNVNPTKKRPVMLWIHGGGYFSGSGNHFLHGPEHIVRKDIVLVTINYRLGIFGFLNLGNEIAEGNQALKDAYTALRWVHDNISNFGGDPENVTLFGDSAGSSISQFLTMYPLADGLYHKVIMQSGTITSPWAMGMEGWEKTFLLTERLGKPTKDPKVAGEFLKAADAKQLIEASAALLTDKELRQFMLPFPPSLDYKASNPFFTQHPFVTMRRGIKVPLLIGYTNNEGSFFTRTMNDRALKLMNSDFEYTVHPTVISMLKEQSMTVEDLRHLYFGNEPITKDNLMKCANFISDMLFYRATHDLIDIQLEQGHRSTYMYQFSYDSKSSFFKKALNIKLPGVSHVEDIFYFFHPHIMHNMGLEPFKPDSEEYKVIDRCTQMWTDFAKTGNPTPAVTDLIPTKWSPVEKGDYYNYLDIDKELQMKTARKGEQRCDWKKMKNKL